MHAHGGGAAGARPLSLEADHHPLPMDHTGLDVGGGSVLVQLTNLQARKKAKDTFATRGGTFDDSARALPTATKGRRSDERSRRFLPTTQGAPGPATDASDVKEERNQPAVVPPDIVGEGPLKQTLKPSGGQPLLRTCSPLDDTNRWREAVGQRSIPPPDHGLFKRAQQTLLLDGAQPHSLREGEGQKPLTPHLRVDWPSALH